jgi:hypothetical protein
LSFWHFAEHRLWLKRTIVQAGPAVPSLRAQSLSGLRIGDYTLGELARPGVRTAWYRSTRQVEGQENEQVIVGVTPVGALVPTEADRARQQARVLADLVHPNLTTVVGTGEDATDQASYLVLQVSRGKTLQQVLDEIGP